MAKMKKNVGDLVSGKLGSVVFVNRKGKNYVRLAPVRKESNWSPKQLAYRARLKSIAELWNNAEPLIKNIFQLNAFGFTGYASYIKENINSLSIDGLDFNPVNYKCSIGKLNLWKKMNYHYIEENNTLQLDWLNDNLLSKIRLNDTLYFMCYRNGSFSKIKSSGVLRNAQNALIELTLINNQPPEYVYVFFSDDFVTFSPSVCIPIV